MLAKVDKRVGGIAQSEGKESRRNDSESEL